MTLKITQMWITRGKTKAKIAKIKERMREREIVEEKENNQQGNSNEIERQISEREASQ